MPLRRPEADRPMASTTGPPADTLEYEASMSLHLANSLVSDDRQLGLGDGTGTTAARSTSAPPAARHPDFATLHSRHGWGIDVRRTYAHLPFQPFWTWLTGKSLWPHPPCKPQQTWLREWQLWLQIAWGYALVVGSVAMGSVAYHSGWPAAARWVVYILCWVLVVNRTRGLLHSFHYTNHGASLADMKRARWIATYFMSIPILHTAWRNYHELHAQVHHGSRSLCTDTDPDQQFMTAHGFRLGMPEREFWLRLAFAPLHPRNLWAHFRFRLEQNFIKPGRREIIPRVIYWTLFAAVVTYFQIWPEIAIFLLFPLFILTQFSSWMQHTTEHLWFPVIPHDASLLVKVGAMTWGRFLGRPYPHSERGISRVLALTRWWIMSFTVDLSIRLFAFMQDLPNHDFHHRSPRVNFWSIAQQRTANEGRPSKYGPMTETWSLWESWLIMRDHLCRGSHDPFGVFAWDRRRRLAGQGR